MFGHYTNMQLAELQNENEKFKAEVDMSLFFKWINRKR